MKVKELLQALPKHLRRDGEILLTHLLRVRAPQLNLILESEPLKEVVEEFLKLIEKRKEGVPTAYLIGEWEFYGRSFKLREGILVPRPETEILVEKTLELIPKDSELSGLEIGVGSGCVSITLLLERDRLHMTGNDISPSAVEITRENARLHGVGDRLNLLVGDMLEPFKAGVFDFIVSNPPYIPACRWESLPPEVRREDLRALIGGEKGWEFYERLSEKALEHLKPGGFVALEIGHDQAEVVSELLSAGGFKEVIIYRDYSGQDRVVIAWS